MDTKNTEKEKEQKHKKISENQKTKTTEYNEKTKQNLIKKTETKMAEGIR